MIITTTRRAMAMAAASAAIAERLRAHDDENPPAIARTALIGGVAGPFAVAGYLMGEQALTKLGLERGSADMEVIHYCPPKTEWSCIVDGLQASTGASLGKMNLRRVDSAATYSVVRHRKSGRSVRLELLPAFVRKFSGIAPEKLSDAGQEVAEMKPAEVLSIR